MSVTGNRLLDALPQDELNTILPRLEPVSLPIRTGLHKPDQPIEHIYFITQGMASVVANLEDGGAVEVGVVGDEGFTGVPALLGSDASSHDVYMQISGSGLRMTVAALREAVEGSAAVKSSLLRYVQYFLTQVSQTAACNIRHALEQRLARWLLMADDRRGNTPMLLTQEFLSIMLGVQRPGVTLAAGALKQSGIIEYTHGRITVIDREALLSTSCECYRAVRHELDRLFG
jgi:CRP-like cAMP-binding protein